MALPEFNHIHCSSRFDRSAESLEASLDRWMQDCSLITLTEVRRNYRAATMREKGWAHFNSKKDNASDDCAIVWKTEYWSRGLAVTRKLNNRAYYELSGRRCADIHSASVVLRRKSSGHKMLVSVTHMPAHIEGAHGWRSDAAHFRARKAAYLSSLANWNTHLDNLERRVRPDATLVVADWNLSLKEHWVRNLLHDRFGQEYRQAWTLFPTDGGSLDGGPLGPLGAPGKSNHDRIIDGSVYKGLKVTHHPRLMPRDRSSDHRPYKESFRFAGKAERPDDDTASGDTHKGDAWWGFGDYRDDEIYEVSTATGAEGGEVL